MNLNHPNIQNLITVAKHLDDILDEVVFVGGSIVSLLISDPLAPEVRPTQDVDLIVEIATQRDYYKFSEKLRAKGFQEETSSNVICRWTIKNCLVDIMPTNPKILGFSNQWYTGALQNASTLGLSKNVNIKTIAPPYFVATKLEAFYSRGKNDFIMSPDIEDIMALIDGRQELYNEIQSSPQDVKDYIAKQFQKLLKTSDFVQNIEGFLPGDSASQARVPLLLENIKKISKL